MEGAANESGWYSSPAPGRPSLPPPPASLLRIWACCPLVCLSAQPPASAGPAWPPAGSGASLTAESVLMFFTSTASGKWLLLPGILKSAVPGVWLLGVWPLGLAVAAGQSCCVRVGSFLCGLRGRGGVPRLLLQVLVAPRPGTHGGGSQGAGVTGPASPRGGESRCTCACFPPRPRATSKNTCRELEKPPHVKCLWIHTRDAAIPSSLED